MGSHRFFVTNLFMWGSLLLSCLCGVSYLPVYVVVSSSIYVVISVTRLFMWGLCYSSVYLGFCYLHFYVISLLLSSSCGVSVLQQLIWCLCYSLLMWGSL